MAVTTIPGRRRPQPPGGGLTQNAVNPPASTPSTQSSPGGTIPSAEPQRQAPPGVTNPSTTPGMPPPQAPPPPGQVGQNIFGRPNYDDVAIDQWEAETGNTFQFGWDQPGAPGDGTTPSGGVDINDPDSSILSQLTPARRELREQMITDEEAYVEAAEVNQATSQAEQEASDRRWRTSQTGMNMTEAGINTGAGALQSRTQNQINQLGQAVSSTRDEFDSRIDDFRAQTSGLLSGLEARGTQNLDQIMGGMTAAMEGVVQGTHAQINAQVSQIDNDPNMNPARKAQLKAQIKMDGVSKINGDLGKVQESFTRLYSETSSQFNQIMSTASTALAGMESEMGTAAGQALSAAETAADQIGAMLQGIAQNTEAVRASEQVNLDAARNNANQMQDSFTLGNLPYRDQPYPQFAGAVGTDLGVLRDSLTLDMRDQHSREMLGILRDQLEQAEIQGFWNIVLQGAFAVLGGG